MEDGKPFPRLDSLPLLGEGDIEKLREVLKPYLPEKNAWTMDRDGKPFEALDPSIMLSEAEDRHYRNYCAKALRDKCAALAKVASGDRNWQLYLSACRTAWAVHYEFIDHAEWAGQLMKACERAHGGNGLADDDGECTMPDRSACPRMILPASAASRT